MTTESQLTQPGAVLRSRANGREYKVSAHPGGQGWRTLTRCDDGTDIMALATDLTNGNYDLVTAPLYTVLEKQQALYVLQLEDRIKELEDELAGRDKPNVCGFEVKVNPLLPENVIAVRTSTMQGILAGLVREYRQVTALDRFLEQDRNRRLEEAGSAETIDKLGREHLLHEDEPSPIPAEVLQAARMQSYQCDREQISAALGLPRDATTEQMAARIHLLVFTKNSLTQKINAMTELAHEIVKKGSRP